MTATASDSDGSITQVAFYQGTTLLSTDTTAPYSYDWANVTPGTYSITAVAMDDANATTTSSAVSVTVTANSPPPSTTNWTHCANEWSWCGFWGETKTVRFGVGTSWLEGEFTNGVNCNGGSFGGVDPLPGTAKTCEIAN
jgi:predicted phage tail protein